MCTVCGCNETVLVDGREISHDEAHRLGLAHNHHDHDHGHAHGHRHAHHGSDHHHYGQGAAGVSVPGLSQARLIEVETSILAKNDQIAQANRRVLTALRALAVNLVSSPGSGKTTLLCKTIAMLGAQPLAVIEGDQQTEADADRIRALAKRGASITGLAGAFGVPVETIEDVLREADSG